jgi:hypothetical protein
MKMDELCEIGNRLRDSDYKTISTDSLIQYLKRMTNTIGKGTIKQYMVALRDEGYIKVSGPGAWEIVKKPTIKKEQNKTLTPEEQTIFTNMANARIIKPEEQDAAFKNKQRTEQQRTLDDGERERYAAIDRMRHKTQKKKLEAYPQGLNILWLDAFEYHVLCDDCYVKEEHGSVRGNISIDDILAQNPTLCEYCGKRLQVKKEEDEDEDKI